MLDHRKDVEITGVHEKIPNHRSATDGRFAANAQANSDKYVRLRHVRLRLRNGLRPGRDLLTNVQSEVRTQCHAQPKRLFWVVWELIAAAALPRQDLAAARGL
jgi:hypothetical protein